MTRSWLRVAVALMAVSLAACSPVPPDAGPADVYSISCARCHGSQLEGGTGPPLGVGSPSVDQSDEYLLTTISRGKGRMPSFSGALTEQQIVDLVAFLREQQAG